MRKPVDRKRFHYSESDKTEKALGQRVARGSDKVLFAQPVAKPDSKRQPNR